MIKIDEYNGFGKVEDLDKEHILLYRELGYKSLYLKGFDTLEDARNFINKNKDNYIIIKRFEGGR